MKILMVYPLYPDSYWSFRNAIRFISKKAVLPPLGLMTVSAMLPGSWEKKLIDMNVTRLKSTDILWADYVLLSAMNIQKESACQVIDECVKYGAKIIAGGPLFTQEYESFPQIDHFVLNEAEITLPLFLDDMDHGRILKKVYRTEAFADLTTTPVPDYSLLSMNDYVTMNMQVGRGCPFACDFCEITSLLGHKVRMKSTKQVLNELETLYKLNWRGPVFIVDDNFIGNIRAIKYDLLPAMKRWMQNHKFPFTFDTQTSVNLADDDELMKLMTETGFRSTFIGIETPDEDSLEACNKVQNNNRDLLNSVTKIQNAGFRVAGGFIVGFDTDTSSVFQRQINFIQQSGIVSAMVGLLNAPRNTKLYKRLESENRLTMDSTGNNTDFSLNFIPRMNSIELLDGYKAILKGIYSEKPYYKRARQFLLNYRQVHTSRNKIEFNDLKGFFRSIFIIGLLNKGRREYWKFLFWTMRHRPEYLMDAVTFTVYGYHFRTIFGLRGRKAEV